MDCACANMCVGVAVKDYSLIKILWASHSLLQLWDKEGTCRILCIALTATCKQNAKWGVGKKKKKKKKKWCFRKRQRQTNVAQTYFFIIFDLIFCDDTVGLLGLLPGEVDAVLLHSLFDDLADLGWSCLEKNMSISAGQTLSACTGIRPAANEAHQLLHQHSQALCTWWIFTWTLLNVYTSWSKFQLHHQQQKVALSQPGENHDL